MLDQFHNVDILWLEFLTQAKLYVDSNEIYSSPSEASTYKIESIQNDVLRLRRNEAGTTETIGRQKFITAIERIKRQLPEIPKGGIYDHVIEETTFVMLLPMLDWSDNGKSIIVLSAEEFIGKNETLNEAGQDDLNNRRMRLVRVRKGQNKFRFNLLRTYMGMCVISQCKVEEVLHGCHILPYIESGDNRSLNGILLRADLHDLFDLNLIAINPETFKVSVNAVLKNTEYWEFNGISIVERSDGKKPNIEALNERWKLHYLHCN